MHSLGWKSLAIIKRYYLIFCLISWSVIGIIALNLPASITPIQGIRDNPKISQIQQNISVISQGHTYWHNVEGYSMEYGSDIVIGHDYDFWNEEWRSWITFNLTQIPDSATITSVGIMLSIEGKPEVCDEVDGQIFLSGMDQNPVSMESAHLLFDLIGNYTKNYGDWSLDDSDSMFSISQNISFDLNQDGNDYFSDSLERDWATLGFSDFFDGGSDSDSDEGLRMFLRSFTIGFTYLNESGLARYDNPPDFPTDTFDDSESSGSSGSIIIIGGIILIGILLLIIRFGPQSKRTQYIRNESTNSDKIYPFRKPLTKSPSPESKKEHKKREKALLYKFQQIMKISKSVSMDYIAGNLAITKQELFDLLISWKSRLPFKIDGEMIIVDDLNDFIANLDENFAEWDEKSNLKDGKM
ncbi:MAG: hypothetical protein ACTSRK_09240 [Promethearchaeota archaeon]